MDAKQFLAFQLEDAGYQLSKCFEGISDAALNAKVTEGSMTPRQACEHLGEAYQAFLATLAGEKHEWGSFKAADQSWPGLWSEISALRSKAAQGAASAESDDVLKMANAYILAHDYYHVGQICAARIQNEPDFDPYCIYQM